MALILLIDDDVMVRETVKQILMSGAHDVIIAQDGRKGMEIFRKSRFDLVITDIIMPEKDGIEVIAEMRSQRPDVKILAVSGGGRIGNTDFLQIAGKLGANAVIAKPFDPDEFAAKVESCLTH
jgi:DNA-binding response OmpR family regulator